MIYQDPLAYLLGLDAPVRIRQEVITSDMIEDAIARLEGDLGDVPARLGVPAGRLVAGELDELAAKG